MVKKDTFKDKPKPPNRDLISADLGFAPSDDVVFLHQFQTELHHGLMTEKSKEPSVGQGQNQDGEDTDTPTQEKINQTYEQVTKLLQLHGQLSGESQQLDEKYEHLQKLGEDVSDSIVELTAAAESVTAEVVK